MSNPDIIDHKKYVAYLVTMIVAHQEKYNAFGKPLRSNQLLPYFTHPLWCSIMILLEPTLPESIKEQGSLALLFHDILEDTTEPLPADLPDTVKGLVRELTVEKEAKYNFSSWEKEKLTILEKPIEVQLLKLYDKTASIYDRSIKGDRYDEWTRIVLKLAENVEKQYGPLNITDLAKTIVTRVRREKKLSKLPS